MLDVDEYLKQLENNDDLDELDKNSYSKNQKSSKENDTISISESTRNKSYSGTQNNQTKMESSVSSNRPGMYGKEKKNMKDFMKSHLEKTRQSGKDAIFIVCKINFFIPLATSSVVQKSRVLKKKKSSANQAVNNRRNS